MAAPTAVRPEIQRLAGRLGAQIEGVDARSAGDDAVAFVRQALLDHKVVFLRDQELDYDGLVAFAQRFGSLTLGHPTISSPDGQPFLEEIDSHKGGPANQWHTDVTFVDRVPAISVLRAITLPPYGGTTVWALSLIHI